MSIKTEVKRLLDKFHIGNILPMEFIDLKSRMNELDDECLYEMFREEWDGFNDNRRLPQYKMDELYESINKKMHRSSFMKTKRVLGYVAASFFLVLTCSLAAFLYRQYGEICMLGERNVVICSSNSGISAVTLPDGTLVRLNKNSVISYSQDFGYESRRVKFSGEGYFEVKKDSGKEFVVGTEYMDITVLGTTFNVYAYEDKDIVEMSLVEGRVNVTTCHSPSESIIVDPDEKVVYNKRTGIMTHCHTTNKAETAWMTKELVFRGEKIEDVFHCLSRKFEKEIVVKDSSFIQDVYTGTFDDDNIDNILNILKMHYGFNYESRSDSIVINSN